MGISNKCDPLIIMFYKNYNHYLKDKKETKTAQRKDENRKYKEGRIEERNIINKGRREGRTQSCSSLMWYLI